MKRVFNRLLLILPALLIQFLWYFSIYFWFRTYSFIFNLISFILTVLFVLYIVYKKDEASYKILWLIVILIFPFFGCWLYLFYGDKRSVKKLDKKVKDARRKLGFKNNTLNEVSVSLKKEDKRVYALLNYISNKSGFPITYNNNCKYYPSGENLFIDLLCELKKAKKFIFIEYFIIQDGLFFNSIVDILEEKVNNGVDVRIIYDDIGSINTFSKSNIKHLADKGIKVLTFNPMLFFKGELNNRDHRKMTIIDGTVVFSGGLNIADEYINQKERFGYWKDIGFKLTGDACHSYLEMFMEFWNAFSKDIISNKYLNINYEGYKKDGYILSYYDSPANIESTSKDLYIEMLSIATDYAWFYTPYLLIGDSLLDAFCSCARRGVDVRIFVPYIPDKKIVNRMTKSYYDVLMKAGVKIYEFTPGFLHAKACLVDDKLASIGTVNLDYRSLFLHFECNSLFYKNRVIKALHSDFLETEKKSKKVTKKDIKNGVVSRMIDSLLRIFAPLL